VEDAAQLYRLLPNGQFSVLPATGHDIPIERPDWLGVIAQDFLARHYH
jgi:pimeloyl-ACP methyl ester carboxylesterase